MSSQVRTAFPAKMGRVNWSRPSLTASFVQSEARLTPRAAATLGARSLPMAVAEKNNEQGFESPISVTKARAKPWAEYADKAGLLQDEGPRGPV